MEVLIFLVLLVMGAMNVLCFIVGANMGQKAVRGEDINVPTIPTVNPFEAYREREAKREVQREADRVATILNNIENYDGTSAGQTDVPGR